MIKEFFETLGEAVIATFAEFIRFLLLCAILLTLLKLLGVPTLI